MKAFHNDQKIKDKYLKRVRAHRAADEIVKGQYWEKGKGCAVGCTIHSGEHASYETELGIPRILARLEDGIFEALPNEMALEWPEKFLQAIPVGADLSKVWNQFAVWLLIDKNHGVLKYAKTKQTIKSINDVANLYLKSLNEELSQIEWCADADADADAAADAYAYAASAADAAYEAYIADAAYAAYAAADAAYEAYIADAAYAAYAAADAAYADARRNSRIAQSVKLLELLAAAK